MVVKSHNIVLILWVALSCHRATLGHPLSSPAHSLFQAGRRCELKLRKRSVYSETKPILNGLEADDKYIADPMIYTIPESLEDDPIVIEYSPLDQQPVEPVLSPDGHSDSSTQGLEPKLASRPSSPLSRGQTQLNAHLISRPGSQKLANAKPLQANPERPSMRSQPVSAYLHRHPSNGQPARFPRPTNPRAQATPLHRLAVANTLRQKTTSRLPAQKQTTLAASKDAQKVISPVEPFQYAYSKPGGTKHIGNPRTSSSHLRPTIVATDNPTLGKVASKNIYSQPSKDDSRGQISHATHLVGALKESSQVDMRPTVVPPKFPQDILSLKRVPDEKLPVNFASEAEKKDLKKMLEDPTPYENVAAMERQKAGKLKENREVEDKAIEGMVQIMTGIQMVGEAED